MLGVTAPRGFVAADSAPDSYRGPKCLRCPITLQMMRHPVLCDDSYTYELEAICRTLLAGHVQSPMTRNPMTATFIFNRAVYDCSLSVIEAAASSRGRRGRSGRAHHRRSVTVEGRT